MSRSSLPSRTQLALQLVFYAAFALAIGYFSDSPTYRHVGPDRAMIRLVISHVTARTGDCRTLTPEELAEIARNMRQPDQCPRERHDLVVELLLDDQLLFRGSQRPTGLWKDGPSSIYRKFAVTPGPHRLVLRLRDSGRTEGFDHEQADDIELRPGQNYLVDFRTTS